MAHAQDSSQRSFFIPFTFNLKVAEGFAGFISKIPKREGIIVAARVDPRRIIPNFNNQFSEELEFVVPLVVFPDEIFGVVDNVKGDWEIQLTNLLKKASAESGRNYNIQSRSNSDLDTNVFNDLGYKLYNAIESNQKASD